MQLLEVVETNEVPIRGRLDDTQTKSLKKSDRIEINFNDYFTTS